MVKKNKVDSMRSFKKYSCNLYSFTEIWVKNKTINKGPRPKVSDESQFHHPPQVHSCNAHQEPKNNDIRLSKVIFFREEKKKKILDVFINFFFIEIFIEFCQKKKITIINEL